PLNPRHLILEPRQTLNWIQAFPAQKGFLGCEHGQSLNKVACKSGHHCCNEDWCRRQKEVDAGLTDQLRGVSLYGLKKKTCEEGSKSCGRSQEVEGRRSTSGERHGGSQFL